MFPTSGWRVCLVAASSVFHLCLHFSVLSVDKMVLWALHRAQETWKCCENRFGNGFCSPRSVFCRCCTLLTPLVSISFPVGCFLCLLLLKKYFMSACLESTAPSESLGTWGILSSLYRKKLGLASSRFKALLLFSGDYLGC